MNACDLTVPGTINGLSSIDSLNEALNALLGGAVLGHGASMLSLLAKHKPVACVARRMWRAYGHCGRWLG